MKETWKDFLGAILMLLFFDLLYALFVAIVLLFS